MLGNPKSQVFVTTFFSKLVFQKKSLMNTIRVSNNLKADQDPYSVSPDLGPNCLQRLSSEIYLFVLILYIPVNNFSVISGQVFLG